MREAIKHWKWKCGSFQWHQTSWVFNHYFNHHGYIYNSSLINLNVNALVITIKIYFLKNTKYYKQTKKYPLAVSAQKCGGILTMLIQCNWIYKYNYSIKLEKNHKYDLVEAEGVRIDSLILLPSNLNCCFFHSHHFHFSFKRKISKLKRLPYTDTTVTRDGIGVKGADVTYWRAWLLPSAWGTERFPERSY